MTLAPSSRVQLTDDGKLRHFLTTEHLPRSLLEDILDTAASFVDVGGRAGDVSRHSGGSVADANPRTRPSAKPSPVHDWNPADDCLVSLPFLLN